jgi:hypothetical protein
MYKADLSGTVCAVADKDLNVLMLFGGNQVLTRNFVPPFGIDHRLLDPVKGIPTDISITPFAYIPYGEKRVVLFDDDLVGTIVGMVFGFICCMGWNSTFPSQREKFAWRGASVLITVSLIPYLIANGIGSKLWAGKAKRGTTAGKVSRPLQTSATTITRSSTY